MSTFKILEYGERADSLWGIENKEITELELEALLEGKRLWTDINWEYAITIRLKDRLKELDIDRENKKLHSIIKEVREYIEKRKDTQKWRKESLKAKSTNIDIVLEQYRDILEMLYKEN